MIVFMLLILLLLWWCEAFDWYEKAGWAGVAIWVLCSLLIAALAAITKRIVL